MATLFQQIRIPQWFRNLQGEMSEESFIQLWRSMTPEERNTHPENPNRPEVSNSSLIPFQVNEEYFQEGGKRRISKVKRTKRKNKKIKRKKAGVPTACSRLKENDCKSNTRCKWNEFDIKDFDMNTTKGKQKLFDLKESLMKIYTKKELKKYFGSEDPTFFQVYMRTKKEYDNGLRGLCGNKMFQGFELSDILKKRVKKDYPELTKSKKKKSKKKKSKVPQKDRDLVEDLLKEAMKKNNPDKEIQGIIERFGLVEADLQAIYDKNNEQFSRLDKFLSPDYDEVSSLLGMVEDEVNLEQNEDTDLQRRLDRLKKAGASKKKNIVPYANEMEEAAYFLSLNNKAKKNKTTKKRTVKTKRNKRSRTNKNRRTKRTKKSRRTTKIKKNRRTKRKTRQVLLGGEDTKSGSSPIMVKWMWDDVGIPGVAKYNPLRWSKEGTIPEIFKEIGRISESDEHRPIRIRAIEKGEDFLFKDKNSATMGREIIDYSLMDNSKG